MTFTLEMPGAGSPDRPLLLPILRLIVELSTSRVVIVRTHG
jgi:hypothetical protein